MKTFAEEAVQIVNFIKASPLSGRLLSAFCNEMGSDHEHLLLHSQVRWLSRGKALTRLFGPRPNWYVRIHPKSPFITLCIVLNGTFSAVKLQSITESL
jgi:hypothetical protein